MKHDHNHHLMLPPRLTLRHRVRAMAVRLALNAMHNASVWGTIKWRVAWAVYDLCTREGDE